MSNAFEAPLRLELKPSKRLRQWCLVVHLPLLLPVIWLHSSSFYVPYVLLCGASLVWHWRASRPRPATLLWRSDGYWEITTAQGPRTACLVGAPFVQPGCVVFLLRDLHSRRRERWVILPDSLDPDRFRRLRVRLRFRPLPTDVA